MKNLILLFIFIPCLTFGQTTKYWNDSMTVTKSLDTVIYPGTTGDISGYTAIMEFKTKNLGLTDTIAISPGGGNVPVNAAKTRFVFSPFSSDSLPYLFIPSHVRIIQDGDTTYKKPLTIGNEPYHYTRPAFHLVTYSDTTFTLYWFQTFAK